MPGWLHQLCFVLFLHTSTLYNPCKGSIQCICTTTECLNEGKSSCTSEHMCYVQNMQGEVASNPGLKPGIIRGCIDDRTPLLCENRKPQVYNGPWPVLHCCKEEWCNKDVIPTVPTPWLQEMKKNPGQNFPDNTNTDESSQYSMDGLPYHQQNDQVQYENEPFHGIDGETGNAKIYRPRQQTRRKTINPLYIAVPVAGACVLLAIIIFAIYILKRQNALMAEYHQQHMKQQNQKLYPIYNGNLKLQQHPNMLGQQQKLMLPNPATTKDLLAVQHSKHRQYSDCSSERSSTGSETKLLMKV